MLVGEQMMLAILIIAVTLGTIAELQSLVVLLSPAADGTFVACDLGSFLHLLTILHSAFQLLWGNAHLFSGS